MLVVVLTVIDVILARIIVKQQQKLYGKIDFEELLAKHDQDKVLDYIEERKELDKYSK